MSVRSQLDNLAVWRLLEGEYEDAAVIENWGMRQSLAHEHLPPIFVAVPRRDKEIADEFLFVLVDPHCAEADRVGRRGRCLRYDRVLNPDVKI